LGEGGHFVTKVSLIFKNQHIILDFLILDINMQHGHGYAAWKCICSMVMDMDFHAAWTMDMDVHPACPYLYYMSQYMLCVNVHAACLFICWMSMSMLYVQVKTARTWTCSMDMDMQHEHGHAGINIGM
jgi:hypothetical protein